MSATKKVVSEPPADKAKFDAFTAVTTAIEPLDRTAKLDVLRAAAALHGIQLGMEIR